MRTLKHSPASKPVTPAKRPQTIVVALVGMPGAGKTEVAQFLEQKGYAYLRFGQIVLDEAMRRGSVNETTERQIRESVRRKYGMGAMALLSMKKMQEMLRTSSVVIDDLYSWEEYKVLKSQFGKERVTIIHVHASPQTRYERLAARHYDPRKDARALYRSYTPQEAQSRDYAQIENLNQGGPIAMADYCIVNESTRAELLKQAADILRRIA